MFLTVFFGFARTEDSRMRRLLGLSAAFAAALALVALSAGPALASHVQCGDVITQHTTLDSDLDCTGNGLVVSGADLTLDLAGHTIRGDGNGFDDIGIQLDGSKITVEDGRVQDFAFDVQLGSVPPSSSSENVLRRLQVANGNGVIGVGWERNRIEDSRFVNTSVSLSEARN